MTLSEVTLRRTARPGGASLLGGHCGNAQRALLLIWTLERLQFASFPPVEEEVRKKSGEAQNELFVMEKGRRGVRGRGKVAIPTGMSSGHPHRQ